MKETMGQAAWGANIKINLSIKLNPAQGVFPGDGSSGYYSSITGVKTAGVYINLQVCAAPFPHSSYTSSRESFLIDEHYHY